MTTMLPVTKNKKINEGTQGGYKKKIPNTLILEWMDKAYDWMQQSDKNIFFEKFIIENAPFTWGLVKKKIFKEKNEDIVDKFNTVCEYQEQKLLHFLMFESKNPVGAIFVLANRFKYTRQDSSKIVEIKDEETEKVIFKFSEPNKKSE